VRDWLSDSTISEDKLCVLVVKLSISVMMRFNLSTRDVYGLLGMHISLFVRQSQNRKAAFTLAYV